MLNLLKKKTEENFSIKISFLSVYINVELDKANLNEHCPLIHQTRIS